MTFKPVKQINTILTQEYFEPTISWALRVVLALNVPLLVLPLLYGFSYQVIWAAFGAYMLALLDYRGMHYKKIVIQCVEAALMFAAAMAGMLVTHSLLWSVVAMFSVGLFAALIRNWREYGASIGVAAGFFFLFGLASRHTLDEALMNGCYLLVGAAWSIFITLISFPLQPSSPVRRSVAKVWKANTDFLDVLIRYSAGEPVSAQEASEKEIAVRTAINQSIDLFARRSQVAAKESHYDALIELRKTAAFFGAALSSMHEELEAIKGDSFAQLKDAGLYKTLSALGQASARAAILIFTFRPEDLTMVKVRVKRFEIALEVFKTSCSQLSWSGKEKSALSHFINTLHKALEYLQQGSRQAEEKLSFNKGDYFENYRLSFNNFVAGLRSQALLDFVRNLANVSTDQFIYALRVSIGLCIGVFIYKFFNIDHGYWIPLTMIIVIQPYYGATRKKGVERVIGTVAGTVAGGLVMLLPLSHQAFLVLLALVSFCVAYFLRNNYKVGVFFVTVMMVVMMQISQQASWQLIGWRVLSTLIGALLALAAGYAFWPVWERQRFPRLMANALLQVKRYLAQVIGHYNKTLPAGESWFRQRRAAEAANSSVFASVQRMYQEPQRVQEKADVYFAMIGAVIRLTREITSLALLLNEGSQRPEGNASLADYNTAAAALFDTITECIQAGKCSYPDFSKIKASLGDASWGSTETLQLAKTELEKIIFELEALSRLNVDSYQNGTTEIPEVQ